MNKHDQENEGGVGWRRCFCARRPALSGPDYQRPDAPVPEAYKETAGWKMAQPADALPRGAWWKVFNDPQLNDLEEQINISNQTVLAAEAQVRQALALVQIARASYFPFVTSRRHLYAGREFLHAHKGPAFRGHPHLGFSLTHQPVLGGRRLGAHPPHGRGQPGQRRGQRRRPRIRPPERSECPGPGLFSIANG